MPVSISGWCSPRTWRRSSRAKFYLSAGDFELSVPPLLALGEVGFDDVRIQFDAESRLIGYLHEAILNVRAVEQQHLIHPAALSGDSFARDVIANRCRPLTRRIREHLAPGIVVRH